ncbi:hypothetical protein HaLaN_03548 [Haematococcus lacustris]|uniref:Uncharacterized protein n=1 Tax=Haematococcus lacustris TaxID=44745 RepID=A0A699YER8_HAELA|nr:hypothetical protein HaLaN_03548 [Haematococcus lacustris]
MRQVDMRKECPSTPQYTYWGLLSFSCGSAEQIHVAHLLYPASGVCTLWHAPTAWIDVEAKAAVR